MSLHKNRLTRVTVEELRAMPHLSGLDLSRNPLRCDEDLSVAIQWLNDNNVTPMRSANREDFELPLDGEPVSQWSDLGKKLCDSWEGGPPPRPAPKKPGKKKPIGGPLLAGVAGKDSNEGGLTGIPGPFIKFDFSDDVSVNEQKVDCASVVG